MTAFLLLIVVNYPYAKNIPLSSHQNEECGWLQDGKPVSDCDNVKSTNCFGGQIWIINDESFFDNWSKPETPKVPITKTALRNKPVFIIFLFMNPGLDQESKADVTADVIIKSPDGKIYGDFKDIEIWKNIYQGPRNSIQLGVGTLTIEIEDNEQLGIYTVEAILRDKIKKISLELQTDFTAKEK